MEERFAGGKLLLDRPAEAVARLTVSNPERRNALDHEILDAIAEVLPQLDRGIETRCVLLTGAPPLFSAGYDIAGFEDASFERDAEALVAHPFHAAMEAIAHHPWPTLAAVNGHCLGGGLELAITCDLRLCAAGAKLGMPPAKLGLIYGHTGLRKFLDTIGLP
ncbi:MAG TPA: enoyl-CoA hydratase/isomerase family protein, partial [Solirubrobacterales bacterium]